ncbi:CCA tRNA nucleotidyltransferase [Croceibacterium sp. TMG7-5b_MA50]|uniref:CCA tRNA nucleotidyltransferase n=1 Tax=Croceibacterium sp. TMG7-5b_MA50 TaxID=3121290 RepID=UPI00322183AF
MTRLPPVPWTARADLAELVAALGPGNLRWVGGAVRDTLLGQPVKDVDAATPLLPEEVQHRLAATGLRSVPTGIAHGTITAVLAEGPVEVTTLRRDVATDGRHATVAFATEWRDDAARRDFTINALYADPVTLEISDYFGGLADLADRRVRFIGDPAERIREDHLRILRYYRFQARFGAELDPAAEAACAELAPTLKGLSRERVAAELLNLLGLSDPASTVARMDKAGVLPIALPERTPDGISLLSQVIAWEQAHAIAPDPLRRLAALLPADVRLADGAAARLRLSTAQRKRLSKAAGRGGDDAMDARALAYRLGMAEALDQMALTGGDPAPIVGWTVPAFPLKGGAIIARGIQAGPDVARILRMAEDRWVAEGFPDAGRATQLLEASIADAKIA